MAAATAAAALPLAPAASAASLPPNTRTAGSRPPGPFSRSTCTRMGGRWGECAGGTPACRFGVRRLGWASGVSREADRGKVGGRMGGRTHWQAGRWAEGRQDRLAARPACPWARQGGCLAGQEGCKQGQANTQAGSIMLQQRWHSWAALCPGAKTMVSVVLGGWCTRRGGGRWFWRVAGRWEGGFGLQGRPVRQPGAKWR